MAQKHYDPFQNMLFIYTPHQALPQEHLCYLFEEIVDQLDYSSFPNRINTPGEPQYDPRLMSKVVLYGYITGVYSSRKLMIGCKEQLPFIYLTRGQAPDFRTISNFRKNNREFLAKAFVQMIAIAYRLGLAKLGTVAADSVKIRANAAQRKVLSEKRLLELREQAQKNIEEAIRLDEREDVQMGRDKTGMELPAKLRTQAHRLEQINQALQSLRETGYQKASLTDPESAQMRNHGQVLPHYSCQISADVENKIIVAADVSRSPADCHQLVPQLDQVEENTGEYPGKVLADNGYYTIENLVELERRGIEGYLPNGPQARDAKLRSHGEEVPERPFEKTTFRYDKEKDIYLCPLGKELSRRGAIRSGRIRYQAQASSCRDCPHKSECTPRRVSRSITRSTDEGAVETMRLRMEGEEGKTVYQMRYSIEPIFAWFKWARGFRRFHLRGKEGVLQELRLLCIGHNIKQIIKHLRIFDPPEAKRRLKEAAMVC